VSLLLLLQPTASGVNPAPQDGRHGPVYDERHHRHRDNDGTGPCRADSRGRLRQGRHRRRRPRYRIGHRVGGCDDLVELDAAAVRNVTHDLALLSAQVTTAIPSGSTVTVTYNTAQSRKALIVAAFNDVVTPTFETTSNVTVPPRATCPQVRTGPAQWRPRQRPQRTRATTSSSSRLLQRVDDQRLSQHRLDRGRQHRHVGGHHRPRRLARLQGRPQTPAAPRLPRALPTASRPVGTAGVATLPATALGTNPPAGSATLTLTATGTAGVGGGGVADPTPEQVISNVSTVSGTTLTLTTTADIPVGRTLQLATNRTTLAGNAGGLTSVTVNAGATSTFGVSATANRAGSHNLNLYTAQVTTLIPAGSVFTITYAAGSSRKAAQLAVFTETLSANEETSSNVALSTDGSVSSGSNGSGVTATATATAVNTGADEIAIAVFTFGDTGGAGSINNLTPGGRVGQRSGIRLSLRQAPPSVASTWPTGSFGTLPVGPCRRPAPTNVTPAGLLVLRRSRSVPQRRRPRRPVPGR
jgi:hypothetical protein